MVWPTNEAIISCFVLTFGAGGMARSGPINKDTGEEIPLILVPRGLSYPARPHPALACAQNELLVIPTPLKTLAQPI